MPAPAVAAKQEKNFHFEVSSPKLFLVAIDAASSSVSLDLAFVEYERKVVIPIPSLVQKVNSTAYSIVAPYAQWGYKKFLAKKVVVDKK